MYLHYPTSFQISLKVFIQGDIVFHLVTWCYKFWEKVRGGGAKSVNKTKHNLNNVIERLQNTELRHQNILIRLFASHHISKQ